MSAPARDTYAPGEALTFWRWLKGGCPHNRPAGLTMPLALTTAVVVAAMFGTAFDWLIPVSEFDEAARGDQRQIDVLVFFPLLGGLISWFAILLAAPRGGRDIVRACLLALLVAAVAQAGAVGAVAAAGIFVELPASNFLILSVIGIAGILPGYAAMLCISWYFHVPEGVVPPRPPGIPEIAAILCIVLPVGLAAAFGFFAAATWFAFNVPWSATAACGIPLGIFCFGFLAVFFLGIEAANAWRPAGVLRGALLLRCGEALLILLAGAVLGQLAGCGGRSMGGGLIDWDSVSAMFGGSSLLAFIAAYWLAAWRMDRFLARHGLRMQYRAAGEETKA